MKRKPTDHGSAAAFQKAWKRAHGGLKDTWGVEYVYEHGALKLWKAALRFARQRRDEHG